MLATVAAIALITISCNKENADRPSNSGKTVSIIINGEFNELTDTDKGTKAAVQSVFRMTWNGGETVYVYGTTDGSTISNLGTLTATVVPESNDRLADLAGTITAPQAGTKLTLILSPEFSSAPAVSSDMISVNLSAQSGAADYVTFVAYATVDYNDNTTTTYRTSFKFATNFLRINASGLETSKALTDATIAGIETICNLTINSNGEPTVTGETSLVNPGDPSLGNNPITKTFTSVSTNDKGNIAFYVATPVITANPTRSLSIREEASHTHLFLKFGTGSQIDGNNLLNTIAAIPTPIPYIDNSVDYGYGTFIPSTGLIWAPFNCGYDPTNYPYGKMYQWGRKYGFGYYTGPSSTELKPEYDFAALYWPEETSYCNVNPTDNLFLVPKDANNDWYTHITGPQLTCWPVKPADPGYVAGKIDNPCPSGWRVPTADELEALITNYSSKTTFKDLQGFFFSGSTAYSDTVPRIFLPAGGCINYYNGGVGGRGSVCRYWVITPENDSRSAWMLYAETGDICMTYASRANGQSIRCVQE